MITTDQLLPHIHRPRHHQAIPRRTRHMRIPTNRCLGHIELAGQRTVQFRVEGLLDLLVVAIVGEREYPEYGHRRADYVHHQVPASCPGDDEGCGCAQPEIAPVDVGDDSNIASSDTDTNVPCREVVLAIYNYRADSASHLSQ